MRYGYFLIDGMTTKTARINTESLKVLEKYISDARNPKFFFTMTEINKVGINPQSGYSTPLGLYCYPLTKEYYHKLITGTLPFAGDKPYVNVFTLNAPTFNLTNYTEQQLMADVKTLRRMYVPINTSERTKNIYEQYKKELAEYNHKKELYEEEMKKLYEDSIKHQNQFKGNESALQLGEGYEPTASESQWLQSLVPEKPSLPKEIIRVYNEDGEERIVTYEDVVASAFESAKNNYPITKFWNLTRLIAGPGNLKKWNVILRQLGYTNFYDPGTGLIHPAEPTQAVIIDPTIIIGIETFYNPYVSKYSLHRMPDSEQKILEQKIKQQSESAFSMHKKMDKVKNPKILDEFAHKYSSDFRVLASIANNGYTSSETLRFIFDSMDLDKNHDDFDLSSDLLNSLIRNKNLPSDIFSKLVKLYPSFLDIMSEDARITPEILEYFADNHDDFIRRQVASHPNSSSQTIEKLLKDPDRDVQRKAVVNKNLDPKLMMSLAHDPNFKTLLPRNPAITEEVLEILARDPDYKVRQEVAISDNATAKVLDLLSQDEKYEIRREVAANEKTSPHTLQKMFESGDYNNKLTVVTNSSAPESVLMAAVEKGDAHMKAYVATNKNTPEVLLRTLAKSTDPNIRASVAHNLKTPVDLLQILAEDPNTNVRLTAQYSLELIEDAKNNKNATDQTMNLIKNSKKSEKIPLSVVKKMPYKTLNRMIKKMRQYLKENEVVQKMFKDYDVDLEEIDYIPMMFGNLDVSAKTDHGVIIFNYRLLCDGDFFEDFSYGVHEMTHWLQQTTGTKATKSSDDGSYLDNPYEQEGFQNQVQYIADQFGEGKAEEYVDDLLEHHEVEGKEVGEKKETLMAKV